MSDWYSVIENGQYRRYALLDEARNHHQTAALGGASLREGVATMLLQLAVRIDPQAAKSQRSERQGSPLTVA